MTTLWGLEWIVAVAGVGAYGLLLRRCFKELGGRGAAFLLFPPALLGYYAPTRWRTCRYPLMAFAACFFAAMPLERSRLGYWAWPDVGRAG